MHSPPQFAFRMCAAAIPALRDTCAQFRTPPASVRSCNMQSAAKAVSERARANPPAPFSAWLQLQPSGGATLRSAAPDSRATAPRQHSKTAQHSEAFSCALRTPSRMSEGMVRSFSSMSAMDSSLRVTSSMSGRLSGSSCQQSCISFASSTGHSAGIGGRNPCGSEQCSAV